MILIVQRTMILNFRKILVLRWWRGESPRTTRQTSNRLRTLPLRVAGFVAGFIGKMVESGGVGCDPDIHGDS